jgi:hypothetical protein
MKFRVCVGREFQCYAAEESSSPVVIQVSQSVAPTIDARTSKKTPSVTSLVFAAVAALIAGATVPATVYGVATGDYAPLKSIADTSKNLLEGGVKLMK